MVTVGLGRHCSCSLLAISISLIVHGSVQAANKEVEDSNSKSQCIVPQGNMTVSTSTSKQRCSDGCCFNKADQSLHCTTPRECEKVQRNSCLIPTCMGVTKKQESLHDSTCCLSIDMSPHMPYILFTFLSLFALTTTAYRKYKATRKWKERVRMVRKRLDMEFPPTVYGEVDNVESKSDDGSICCICLDGLEGTIVRKLHCSHVLHQGCFDKWCLHSSDPTSRKGLDMNTPEELAWVCPLCKHPAMPDIEHAGPTRMITVVEQGQSGSYNTAGGSEDEQPEVIVEQPPTQRENCIPRWGL